MVNEFVFGAIIFVLGIVFLLSRIHQQPLHQVLKLIGVLGIGVGSFAFSHITTKADLSPKTPIIIACFIVFLAVILDSAIGKKNRTLRGILSILFPFIFLIISNDWFHIGTIGFSGLELFKIGIIGTITPWVFYYTFSKIKISNDLKRVLELGFYGLFLALAIFVSIFLGGQIAFFSLFCCFYATYSLMQKHFFFGKETVSGFLIALIIFVLLPSFVVNTTSLDSPSVLLGLFLGIFLIPTTSVLSVWKSTLNDRVKAVGISVFIIAIFVISLLSLLILEKSIGIGGRTSVLALLIGSALSILFLSPQLKNHFIAPATIFLGLIMLLLPTSASLPIQNTDKTNALYEEVTPLIEIQQTAKIDSDSIVTKKINLKISTSDTNNAEQIKVVGLASKIGKWKIEQKKSSLLFEIDALGDKVKGKFNRYSGSLKIVENIENSLISITIPVNSINTENDIRDESLINNMDFFEAKKYPVITFSSKNFKKLKNNLFIVKGVFTMKGISKTTTFTFKYLDNKSKLFVIQGKGKIDRTQFGMPADASMSNEVYFQFSFSFKKI